MYVIGTAGHVDHGKSTIVHALTGIDPDRLREEKERGLTIDLGFAWLTLPSGRNVSVVDVPGHERFIKNMLAGVGCIDLALLVIAADEGVMPQTREHLAILDLLDIKRALAIVTKCDLVDEEKLQFTQLEVEDLLVGTSLNGTPILPVSATTGQGLNNLLSQIDQALDKTERRINLSRPRLSVDRAFSIAGFGTIATGTLIDGTLKVGDEVELVLTGRRSRVRGLQTHRALQSQADPGTRVAVNLSSVSPKELSRGEVLATPGWLKPTRAIDARIRILNSLSKPLRHNLPVTLHAHTMETSARLRLLETNSLDPGQEGWVQILLKNRVALVPGDRFVVRSADETLGGGVVVDIDARRHRRRHDPTVERLTILSKGSPTARLIRTLEDQQPANLMTLSKRANLGEIEAVELTRLAIDRGQLVALGNQNIGITTVLYTETAWGKIANTAKTLLSSFHQAQPLQKGMLREELRSKLGLTGQVGTLAFAHLIAISVLTENAGLVSLPEHKINVTNEEKERMDWFIEGLEAAPYESPYPIESALMSLLIDNGQIIKVGNGILFAARVYKTIEEAVMIHLHQHGSATVAEVRDLLNTSRKYAVALLEHLDERHITKRLGDKHVLI